jgi:hypothetical protein
MTSRGESPRRASSSSCSCGRGKTEKGRRGRFRFSYICSVVDFSYSSDKHRLFCVVLTVRRQDSLNMAMHSLWTLSTRSTHHRLPPSSSLGLIKSDPLSRLQQLRQSRSSARRRHKSKTRASDALLPLAMLFK